MAWEAAKLPPDNDDRIVYILLQGGTFVKYRDPQFADIFYKALVCRNRKTVLGAEADKQRWFPTIDEDGNILQKKKKLDVPEAQPDGEQMEPPSTGDESNPEPEAAAPAAAPSESGGVNGYRYVVHSADSVATILQAFAKSGVVVSRQEFLNANPGLDPGKLRVGDVVVVPGSTR